MPTEDEKDWSTATLREVPFWRDGMTVEEYEEERTYYIEHYDPYDMKDYLPLWKQREQAK